MLAALCSLAIVVLLILGTVLAVFGLTVGIEYVELRLRRRRFLKRLRSTAQRAGEEKR